MPGMPQCRPTCAAAFIGARAQSATRDGGRIAVEPTPRAAAWADAHRRMRCEHYDACLGAAATEQTRGRLLNDATWVCDACAHGT